MLVNWWLNFDLFSACLFVSCDPSVEVSIYLISTRVRYYRCGAPVKHRCKCFTVSPVQNYFTGVLIFAVNGAFSYKT